MSRPGRWVDPFAGQPGRRTFVAVTLPQAAVDAVAEVVGAVRAMGIPAGSRDVRWVRLDGLHLTLRFLGPTVDKSLGPTSAAVLRAAQTSAPIEAELGGAGTFPPEGRPRAIWIGLTAGADALATLAGELGRQLATAGWPVDERPFRPHLTLARSDGIPAGRLVADRLAEAMTGLRIPAMIDRIGLFESVTGEGPARYLPITEAALGASPNAAPVYHPDIP